VSGDQNDVVGLLQNGMIASSPTNHTLNRIVINQPQNTSNAVLWSVAAQWSAHAISPRTTTKQYK
jgi:hypothetical protein